MHPHSLTPRQCSLSWMPLSPDYPWPLVITPTSDAPLATIHRAYTKPRSTRSATKAMQQELIVKIPVTKKPTRAKKDKNMHEEPEDVPQITTKDKGKGRDLTNLGSSDAEEEKDEGEDAKAEKSDEEGNKEKDADAGSNGDEDGELKKTDDEDDNEDNAAEVTMPADLSDNDEDAMEVDPTTPKRPTTASKRRASASPTTAHQMGKGLCKDITHASASSHQASPSPMSDDLEDLQGASRTVTDQDVGHTRVRVQLQAWHHRSRSSESM
ncbi:hypothetical protein BDN71DRAFT_1512071 [Pleurotus eryngii]|uniref:Uncharacterized protein n=1 Tax=Pleurotus eryngii TaxID=5323 RepID=A0A9P5ZK07_PLEER|nr:hypothetical protein BDN71DRAFT_1512071 [Pleurotus eryngii]